MKSLFQDGKGNYSSMRFVVVLTGTFFFLQWGISLWTTGTFAPAWELVGFVSSAVLGKAVQSKYE